MAKQPAAVAFLLLGLLALNAAAVSYGSAAGKVDGEVEGESLTSDVLVLDVSNFTDTVEKHDFIVVEVYAPWCGYCKKLAPEYEKAATTLKSHDRPIILAKVDANEDENWPLAEKFGVKGFPTLIIFRNKGEFISYYKGTRDEAGIVDYLKKLSGSASVELTSAQQTEEFLKENEKETVVIGVFDKLQGEEYENFTKVVDAQRQRSSYVFAHTVDASYLPESDVPVKAFTIRIYKNFDDKTADSADFSTEDLTKFLETESLPLITKMSKKKEHIRALLKFTESHNDKVFLFRAGSQTDEDPAAVLAALKKDAKDFKEKGLIFMFAEEEENAYALQFFGLKAENLPAYVIQTDKGEKYVSKNAKPEQLSPWLDDFLAGNLKVHIKSEPVPLFNDQPVKVVVADSFKEVVIEAGKDVLLEFYAPLCVGCMLWAPILDEVAVSFESDPDVVIAKFDAAANDVDSDLFDVRDFPTLYFYNAEGVITPYDGERTKEAITEFINEHRSKPGLKKSDAAAEETTVLKDEL
ncbi:unnamed protein product [Calypogeia fissa]